MFYHVFIYFCFLLFILFLLKLLKIFLAKNKFYWRYLQVFAEICNIIRIYLHELK